MVAPAALAIRQPASMAWRGSALAVAKIILSNQVVFTAGLGLDHACLSEPSNTLHLCVRARKRASGDWV